MPGRRRWQDYRPRHRPEYVPAGAKYVYTRTYGRRPWWRYALGVSALLLALLAAAVLLAATGRTSPGTMPGRGVSPIPTPDASWRIEQHG